MRICILAERFLGDSELNINGAMVQSFALASGWVAAGYEVNYLVPSVTGCPRASTVQGIGIQRVGEAKLTKYGLFPWRALAQALNSLRPDIVYVRGRTPLAFLAGNYSRRNGARLVWASNGEDGCRRWKNLHRLQRRRTTLWKKAVLMPRAAIEDVLIHNGLRQSWLAVNQTLIQKRELRAYFRLDGVILPPAFEIPRPVEKEASPKIVLWLGSLSPAKQPDLFLRLAEALQDIPGWEFWLGGSTSDRAFREKIDAMAARLPAVRILGQVRFAATTEFFGRASIFVSTSESEGFSNTMIQAWLAGTPVASLRADPDGVINRQGLGFCAAGDFSRLCAGVRGLMSDAGLRLAAGRRARDHSVQTYRLETVISQYRDLFEAKIRSGL